VSSPRSVPVAVVGSVNVLVPSGASNYYRLTWTQPDGRPGRTTGSANLAAAKAKAKAASIDAGLQRAAGGLAMHTLSEIVIAYLSTPVGRNQKTGGDWGRGQLAQASAKLNRCLRGHENARTMDLNGPPPSTDVS
jgi:hypothetical protein